MSNDLINRRLGLLWLLAMCSGCGDGGANEVAGVEPPAGAPCPSSAPFPSVTLIITQANGSRLLNAVMRYRMNGSDERTVACGDGVCQSPYNDPPGEYTFTVEHPGYMPQTFMFVLKPLDVCGKRDPIYQTVVMLPV